MNGAAAVPPPKTTKKPIINNTKVIGKSHHFFLSFKKLKKSIKNSIGFNLISWQYVFYKTNLQFYYKKLEKFLPLGQ